MKKKIIITAIVLIIIIGIVYYYYSKKAVKSVSTDTTSGTIPSLATPTYVATNTASDNFPLKIGSKGPNVTYLQNALKKLGANIIVDGNFGQQTYSMLITKINTTSYPVTQSVFTDILKKSNSL